MLNVFTTITAIDTPKRIPCETGGRNAAFELSFTADGAVPFPQIIVRQHGEEYIASGDGIRTEEMEYIASIPHGIFFPGEASVQAEGCRQADIASAADADWVKDFATVHFDPAPHVATAQAPSIQVGETKSASTPAGGLKIYFGIHKHMHQPYYRAADTDYWDGEKDEIFGSRGGPYTSFIPSAVRQYVHGGLPHAGLSTSWSGTLIEQLTRCGRDGLCGGCFGNWSHELREMAQEKTALGNPRVDFSAFGFFHPLMALVPGRNIVKQIEWHRTLIRETFGAEASRILFPPETAFHIRMIPALNEAGVKAVIYDSIHRFRTCRDYPYCGVQEGMLPPNQADQVNPSAPDWMQLQNIWAGSKIAPSLLRPEYVQYEDPDGKTHKIIAIPAERYIGNEDARGGFGALQYPDVLGQVYDSLIQSGIHDPQHPPFFLLHSDGDNHGGGADSYYTSNTGQLVQWLQSDGRFELTSAQDYLDRFPPDPSHTAHIEPGSWSGADNGDPQFMKWFSRYHETYSPDLNSWAVLTALQNAVHSLEDARPNATCRAPAERLMLTAETSCYWYWTGQDVWDQQVTDAANAAHGMMKGDIDALLASGEDRTGPTIFAPWITPENPGGKRWGQGCLEDAARMGTLHTFIADISGLQKIELHLRTAKGQETIELENRGLYPSQTGAHVTSGYFTADLPVGAGDVRYYIEAVDGKGNMSRSALERVFLA